MGGNACSACYLLDLLQRHLAGVPAALLPALLLRAIRLLMLLRAMRAVTGAMRAVAALGVQQQQAQELAAPLR